MTKRVVYENATANPKVVFYTVGDSPDECNQRVEPKGKIKLRTDLAFNLIKTETVD